MSRGESKNDIISRYLELIPLRCHWKLDKELDFDNEVDRDLVEIAQYIISWEVKLRVPLGLTEPDVLMIKEESNPILRQRQVLRIWRRKRGFDATYRNLLKCVAVPDHEAAKKICALQSLQEPTACFPYLPCGTMSEDQFSMLKARLRAETNTIKLEFASLMFDLQKDLEKTLPLEDLVSFLALYDVNYKSVLNNCGSYSEVFFTLRKEAVNFFDYNLLELLINKFGSDTLKVELERYRGYFEEYSQRLVVECPSDAFGECESSKKNLVLVAGKDFETLTLDDLKRFELSVNKILGNKLVMVLRVEGGSICITFRMFEDKNFNITKEQRQALQEEDVTSIIYEDRYIIIQPLSGVTSNSWVVRLGSGGKQAADELARRHGFINLGLIDGDPDIFQDGMYRFVLPVPENLYEFKLPVSAVERYYLYHAGLLPQPGLQESNPPESYSHVVTGLTSALEREQNVMSAVHQERTEDHELGMKDKLQ